MTSTAARPADGRAAKTCALQITSTATTMLYAAPKSTAEANATASAPGARPRRTSETASARAARTNAARAPNRRTASALAAPPMLASPTTARTSRLFAVESPPSRCRCSTANVQ
jgi:hypothetical protein